MEFFNSALGKNISFVRPPYFIITGLTGIPHVNYYWGIVFFIYVGSMIGNISVMAVIILGNHLKSPKYIAVFNLIFTDVLNICALVPKVIDTFLFNNNVIPYRECLVYMLFTFVFLSMQSFNLVVLAIDRLIAIAAPLHYHVKVTKTFIISIIAFFWIYSLTLTLVAMGLITRLSICESVIIQSHFCDHGPIYRLGCNDLTPSHTMAGLSPTLKLWLPLFFIVVSYIFIGYTIVKISVPQERVKALKTCSAHLSLVAVYYVPFIFVYRFGSKIPTNARVMSLSINAIVPPMLNPIIYVLQTKEIKDSIKKMLKFKRL
ncbi:olfactory receptor 1C1-like, partial [Periophthalmus magnuspinnatus]|uniref:olfactory receptor 1C1-like n=1 Tax=Periophthalmus magnuspinnatus TaxID=409849 RepID=UPI00145BC321